MSKIYANPFFWGNPVNGNNYLVRPLEEQQISAAIENQTHLIISGNRGTGKTSLVQSLVKHRPDASLYLDLRFAVRMGDIQGLLLDEMEKAFPKIVTNETFQAFRETEKIESLSPVLDFLYEQAGQVDTRLILVWDEFHHILKFKDNTMKELKKNLPNKPGLTNIFVSHREDLMQETFGNSKQRLVGNYEHIDIGPLNEKAFTQYLTTRFRRMGLNDFDLAGMILKFTGCLPQLSQKVAHSLAQLWLEGNTTSLLDRTIKKMLQEHNALFTAHWDNFGLNEKRMLLGLASGHSRPTELGFISKYGLSATSTAHNTVLKLLREGWLSSRDEGYYLYDPLFLKWLQNRSGIS